MNKYYPTGLVVGSFNPPHMGHIRLLSVASDLCETVIVQVSKSPIDILSVEEKVILLRKNLFPKMNFEFIIFEDEMYHLTEKGEDNVVINQEYWDFYISELSKQLAFINKYPVVIISSEEYAEGIANQIGCESIRYDTKRELTLISSTQVRNKINSGNYTSFIGLLPETKEKYSRKVCVVGTEGSGKTTLVKNLGYYLSADIVMEYGRSYSEGKDTFSLEDFVNIAIIHNNILLETSKNSTFGLVVSDTDALITKIFAKFLLSQTDFMTFSDWIEPLIKTQTSMFDLYLITNPLIYHDDNGSRLLTEEQREEFFSVLISELVERQIKYIILPDKSTNKVRNKALNIIKANVTDVSGYITKRG